MSTASTTSRISVNIDENVKKAAQQILGEIGMDMTTAIDTFLRTVIREECIPLNLQTQRAHDKASHKEYIITELAKAKAEASNPHTEWISQESVKAKIIERRKERNRVQG